MKTTFGRLATASVAMVCTLVLCQVPLSFGEHKHGEKPEKKFQTHHEKQRYKAWKEREEQGREAWKHAEEQEREARKHHEEQEREARKFREEQKREGRKHREEQRREASQPHGGYGHQGGSHSESPPPANGPKIEVQTEHGSIGVQL